MNQQVIKEFEDAVESLRQYRRYELLDESNRDLLNEVYVDPLDNNSILDLCLKDNTTVLVGRKGTGKSTIYMRMQNELRNKKDVITCYLDVKTIFEKSKKGFEMINYLGIENSTEREIYSIQRKFTIDFISELIKEIGESYTNKWDRIISKVGMSKPDTAIKKLKLLEQRILNNTHLQEIELQVITDVSVKQVESQEAFKTRAISAKAEGNVDLMGPSAKANAGYNSSSSQQSVQDTEKSFSRVFARVFDMSIFIDEIKNILKELKMKRLYIILDDYSEVDQAALRMFCDLVVNSLNNHSDNFIKLKISAYPGRVELGELDRQKIDIRYLDYYDLYNYDNRDDMEESAKNYTKRIIEKRLKVYTKKEMGEFFDLSKGTEDEYYKLIFQMTLNVVRHIGLILDYAKDISLKNGNKITLGNLHDAAQKFYKERLSLFFKESRSTLMTYDERIERLQLEDLLKAIILKSKSVKSDIRTRKYNAKIFDSDRSNPYCSHFNLSMELESVLASLELNFFVNKYNEMSNKMGQKVSIYGLNYGLALQENIKWGKPSGNEHRTYFIESQFNYNGIIKAFLNDVTKIECQVCGKTFESTFLPLIEANEMNCIGCGARRAIKIVPLVDSYHDVLEEVNKSKNLLEKEYFVFLSYAACKGDYVTPKEMSQEMDVTHQKIGWMTKRLEENYGFIVKDYLGSSVKYYLTDAGKEILI